MRIQAQQSPQGQALSIMTELVNQLPKLADHLAKLTTHLDSILKILDDFLRTSGSYSTREASRALAQNDIYISQWNLSCKLESMDWTHRVDGTQRIAPVASESGYLVERPRSYYDRIAATFLPGPPEIRITAKGLINLSHRLHIPDSLAIYQYVNDQEEPA